MATLPAEVVDLIVCEVASTSDLKNLRLVSKSVSKPATRELFSKIFVTLPGLLGPQEWSDDEEDSEDKNEGDESASRFNNVLTSSMCNNVRNVQITTSLDPNKDLDDYQNNEMASVLSKEMKDLIISVKNFPNLSSLNIEFSCVCASIDDYDYMTMQREDDLDFRKGVLKTLLAAVSDPTVPLPRLKSLSIKNLQNFNDEAVVKSQKFTGLLKRLEELRLKIVIQRDEASPESSWNHQDLYTFMAELPSIWLQPVQVNLTRLTLHMSDFWGYMPKADFRNIHFPKLKSLELGNYTFSHDWQLDWIISHETLLELVLDDCPIVRRMYSYSALDPEGYFLDPVSHWGQSSTRRYDGTWAEYFERLERMPRLRKFRFGIGEWDDGGNFDGGYWTQEGMHDNMYTQFDRGIGPTPWQPWVGSEEQKEDEEQDDEKGEEDGEEDIEESTSPPWEDQERADAKAYEIIMAILARRQIQRAALVDEQITRFQT